MDKQMLDRILPPRDPATPHCPFNSDTEAFPRNIRNGMSLLSRTSFRYSQIILPLLLPESTTW